MVKKKYVLHTDLTGNCFIVGNCCKFGMFDKLEKSQVIRIIDLLNSKDKQIDELKIRNKRQYDSLKEVWELIFARDWDTLEEKAKEIEKAEELLQKEFYWRCNI